MGISHVFSALNLYLIKMKIICVGRNYAAHAKELGNEPNETPVIFLKPDTALLKDNQPFYYPRFSNNIQYEAELIVKIDKEGKFIEKKFAHKYYNEIGLGIDFTARDLQNHLKAKGLPWEIAKAFNHSAAVSHFFDKNTFGNIQNLPFKLLVNGEERQTGNTSDMQFTVDDIIAYASEFFTLKKGDIVFTGTPQGVGAVQKGDYLEGFLADKPMFAFYVK